MTQKPLSVAVLTHTKETKNMHRYDEINALTGQPAERSDAVVNNIYLSKRVLNGAPAPKFLKLIIEEIQL